MASAVARRETQWGAARARLALAATDRLAAAEAHLK
jgi:hypothetical protein